MHCLKLLLHTTINYSISHQNIHNINTGALFLFFSIYLFFYFLVLASVTNIPAKLFGFGSNENNNQGSTVTGPEIHHSHTDMSQVSPKQVEQPGADRQPSQSEKEQLKIQTSNASLDLKSSRLITPLDTSIKEPRFSEIPGKYAIGSTVKINRGATKCYGEIKWIGSLKTGGPLIVGIELVSKQ